MILILSSDSDASTTSVLLWLSKIGTKKFIKINPYNIPDFSYVIHKNTLSSLFSQIDLEKIDVIWYRRHKFVPSNIVNQISDTNLKYIIHNNIEQEKRSINQYMFHALKDKIWVTNPNTIRITKLIQLIEAKNLGIDVPATVCTHKKQDILDFKNIYSNIIVKPIDNSIFISLDDSSYFLALNTT